jgi:hypothetical protein
MSTDKAKKAKQAYLEKHPDRAKESCQKYYQKNKAELLKKKREKYRIAKENAVKITHDNTRNYRLLIEKLGNLSGWKKYTSDSDISQKKLLNKLTKGMCLHCLCGHRVGKLEKNDLQPHSDENPEMTKICEEAFEKHRIEIEKKARNSITSCYDECSLLPMVREGSNDYILIGKKCAKYFDLSDTDIRDLFKSKEQKEKQKEKQEKKERNDMQRKMSQNPKILLEPHEMIDRGKYKGMSIYKINTLKGGPAYLEFITRWSDLSQLTIDAIEDLLSYSL